MIKSYFITGTDTDCGKTYVTVALLQYLHQQKMRARALKPIASGCHLKQGVWVNDDVQRLEKANGNNPSAINHLTLRSPISPNLAAAEEGVAFTAAKIKSFYEAYPKTDLDYLLVEGAGGLLVPLNEQETWLDFLVQTRMPVLLVVGMRLGCMNHALLTAYALRKQHIPCHGWIANFLDPNMLAQAENLQTLQHWLAYPFLGSIPYQGVFCPASSTTRDII
ncbi:MAG: dethiobiotin synthase [Legionellales bacterium]|nr:dethiobiotin synthase [Legionellales bacterium]